MESGASRAGRLWNTPPRASLLWSLLFIAPVLNLGESVQAATNVYYSVGTSTADLKSSAALRVTISAGLAAFSEAQAANIGVGDLITYSGSQKAYISGRRSSTLYSVITRTGGVPVDVTNANVNSIKRAFNSLSAAVANSSDNSHLNTSDLVAGNFELNLACYNDLAMNDRVTIDGYTTGPSNFIRIYTPLLTSEVGSSQSHVGRAGTGFRMAPITAAPVNYYDVIHIMDDYVRLEGIEIDGSNITNAENIEFIEVSWTLSPASDIRMDRLLLHDLTNSHIDDSDESEILGFSCKPGRSRSVTRSFTTSLTSPTTPNRTQTGSASAVEPLTSTTIRSST